MLKIAHRGASAVAPENTLAAFRLAAEMGADAIETDLRLTSDGAVVAIHDEQLSRTTNGRGLVAATTLAAIRGLEAGRELPLKARAKFAVQRVPTMDEVLALARRLSVGCYLEIKASREGIVERAVVEALRKQGASRHVVISFDEEILRSVRETEPAVTIGLLTEQRGLRGIARAEELGAREVLQRGDRVNEKFVMTARAKGLSVVVWTVDDLRRMRALAKMGVAGIISNRMERLVKVG
ncbi:MAG TPA: glycerophosphodiester phosphodiesterase family protein [Candidatus Acidoferrales bacterium]|nr:glycerophosphodiester phosphodiesterase family protein [Candidatus Acidoferrales bacterium]